MRGRESAGEIRDARFLASRELTNEHFGLSKAEAIVLNSRVIRGVRSRLHFSCMREISQGQW